MINIFSFSKSYGLMGWRVGFLAFDTSSDIGDQLMKVQDTIPICATIIRWGGVQGCAPYAAPLPLPQLNVC